MRRHSPALLTLAALPATAKDWSASEWSDSPAGFNLLLRLYSPRTEVLGGTWTPPLVKRVK